MRKNIPGRGKELLMQKDLKVEVVRGEIAQDVIGHDEKFRFYSEKPLEDSNLRSDNVPLAAVQKVGGVEGRNGSWETSCMWQSFRKDRIKEALTKLVVAVEKRQN